VSKSFPYLFCLCISTIFHCPTSIISIKSMIKVPVQYKDNVNECFYRLRAVKKKQSKVYGKPSIVHVVEKTKRSS
jgi:hypothetical protein